MPPLVFPEGTRDLSNQPEFVSVRAVMTRPVLAFAPKTPVGVVRDTLKQRGVHGAPIIDEDRYPLGMVSRGDLARALERDVRNAAAPVEDVMMCFAFSLPLRSSVGQAAALMAYEGLHRLLITDNRGRVIGIVSTLDIARWVGEQAGLIESQRRSS